MRIFRVIAMVGEALQLHVRHLRAAKSREDYAVYRAALEWSLVDPIIIDGPDDLKSESRWKDRVEPFHHQVTNLITFCRRLPVTLLADDVGLGKTISAGLIASELIARRRLHKLLIVAPKLLGPQWKEELETKFNIPTDVVTGRKLVDADPTEEVGAVVTTYHSARLYIGRVPKDRFQMLVLDEAHKLRNLYGVPNPPQVAQRFRDVLAERMFKYVLMLTATPIQNRLWDLYSLVELLTVARGHQNPFGASGMFIRKYIADHPSHARQLREEAREQFRSIVYSYMSRIRRGDANLHFPERKVLLRGVSPTREELALIEMIAGPVRKLKNRLAQISILQALTSSPHALAAQLENMGRNGTFPADVALQVRRYVKTMPPIAKLVGVGALAEQLRAERARDWRMVVFTHRRETQTTIQAFLEAQRISVGIINGDSGLRNQQTIARFRKDPPELNVVVSTEAGSEGVNLQAANVLVNFDLPWNPMIVEQRIGRIQRLASEFAKVFVYSVILNGTFEEYIIARLMEKLQMASHAIGDVESLLDASGLSKGDQDGRHGFEEEIRRLVLESLAGKDVREAVRRAEASIEQAKAVLAEQEANINAMLGAMDGAAFQGPRSPVLPPVEQSMPADEFARSALVSLGGELRREGPDLYSAILDGKKDFITFAEQPPDDGRRVVRMVPGTQAFDRLVGRVTQSAVHRVRDLDSEPRKACEELARDWFGSFASRLRKLAVNKVWLCYAGTALIRVRATVAHDSYERLVNVPCAAEDHRAELAKNGLNPIPSVVSSPRAVGLDQEAVVRAAIADPAVEEFCRFYEERRVEEIAAAGADPRKRQRAEDEFTPRLEAFLVGLEGETHRIVHAKADYEVDGHSYRTALAFCPHRNLLLDPPPLAECAKSARKAPENALGTCAVSGTRALRHLLVKSEFSERMALPEHALTCALSGQRMLSDEADVSAVTQNRVAKALLRVSALSGRKAEPEHFAACAFTHTVALSSELATSEVSSALYRPDEATQSSVSGKRGHRSEFVHCALSGRPLVTSEGERCEVTGATVMPGELVTCAVSGKKALPSLLERSSVSRRWALKDHFVSSSVSGARLLESEAVVSALGQFCTPQEAQTCIWAGRLSHPDDLRVCQLSGKPVYFQFARDEPPRLKALAELLDGTWQGADGMESWDAISRLAALATRARCEVISGQVSPDGNILAVCLEHRTLLGFRVQHAGCLYSIPERAIVGRIALGKRGKTGWAKA